MINSTDKYVKIDTLSTSLVIGKDGAHPLLLYYGKKLHDGSDFFRFLPGNDGRRFSSNSDPYTAPSIISYTGDGCQREHFAAVVKDGVFTNRFVLKDVITPASFESPLPTARGEGQSVCFVYTDLVSSVTLKQYFTVFSDSDVICAHSEIVNTSDGEVRVRRLSSLQLDLVGDSAKVISFDGTWGHERDRHETKLNGGKYENSSVSGISSGEHNPFLMVEAGGGVMGLNIIWSGNHREVVEISPFGRIRILTGMNDYALDYPLAAGESLVSPQAIVTFAKCEAELTNTLHKFSLDHIVAPQFAYKERPVLINNWEGTYFDFTGEKIYQIAEAASKCGIEMMVLDDGWFGERNSDKGSLGDWFDNVEKTGGLPKLASRIHDLGMKFGLWVEPEMICRESELFKAHPEFAQIIPDVDPLLRRSQLCMDLCNDEVVDCLADRLITIFTEIGVDYVKWDHNRSMSDVYSSKLEDQGRYFYDYYKNQTRMLRRITEACPNILFESCSSGGCRFDLGMQYFMAQNWGSDNTNSYDRLYIQEGTLTAYPQSSMGSHVAINEYLPFASLETRFNVAAVGAFGYELDITKMSEEDLKTVSAQVAYYKEHKKLLQYGNYRRLGQPISVGKMGGWIVVSDDKSEAMATLISTAERNNARSHGISFAGLDPDALYEVTSRPQTNYREVLTFRAYGDALMNGHFDFDMLACNELDGTKNGARFASRMLYIKKIG